MATDIALARKVKELEAELGTWKKRAAALAGEQEALRYEIGQLPTREEMGRLAVHTLKLVRLLDRYAPNWREENEMTEEAPVKLTVVGGAS